MLVIVKMSNQDECVDLRQMRYVVAVAEERSFTRAAEKCFVVQSALSHQIKAVERELGVKLFARTSRRVDLTPAGEAFLEGARECLAAAERAATEAAAADGLVRGVLSIGVIPTVTAVDIPVVLVKFHQAHPAVRIKVRGGGSDEFIAAIAAGSLDLAFLGLAEAVAPPAVAARELARARLAAVLPTSHRFAHRRRLHLEDLAEETFVDFPAGTPGRAQTDLAFRAAGLCRDVAFEAVDAELMLGLVRHGLAVALLSPRVVPGDAEVVTVAVSDGPRRVEYLAWSEFNPSPAVRAFLAVVRDHEHPDGGQDFADST